MVWIVLLSVSDNVHEVFDDCLVVISKFKTLFAMVSDEERVLSYIVLDFIVI